MKTILVAITLVLGVLALLDKYPDSSRSSCSDTSKAEGTAPAVTEYTKKSGSIPVVNGRGDTIDVKYTCEGCGEIPKAVQHGYETPTHHNIFGEENEKYYETEVKPNYE